MTYIAPKGFAMRPYARRACNETAALLADVGLRDLYLEGAIAGPST
jgi:hypothetical protein